MTKLTPELQDKFLKLLELGVPIKYACQTLNIGEATYFRWMDLGQRDKDRPESKFREFRESVQSIPGKAMARKLAHLEKAAEKGNITATTWFLEHKFPEEFKQAQDINLSVKPTVQQLNEFYELKEKEKEKKKQPLLEGK